jgi:hypothetical protein
MSAAMTRAWLGNITMAHSLLLETQMKKNFKRHHFLDSKNGQNKKKSHGTSTPLQQSYE